MSDSTHYKTACASCNGRIEFPAAAAGATIRCPHCGASTTLAAPGETASAPAPAAAPATTKSPCQHCQGSIAYPTAAAGSTVNCPHCGKPTQLGQAAGSAVQDGMSAVLDEINAEEAKKPKRKFKPGGRGTADGEGSGKGKLIAIVSAAVVLVIAVIGGVLAMNKKEDKPAGPTRPEYDLEVLKHNLQKAKEGGLVYVVGTVTNHGDGQYFRLNIEFELSDRDGKSLGSTTDYIGNLAGHGTWEFKAIVLESSAANAKLVKVEGEPESGPAPAAKSPAGDAKTEDPK